MIVRLTPEQEDQAEARLKRILVEFAGVPDRAGVKWTEEKRRLGIRGEIAASVAVGYPLSPGLRDHYDLSGLPVHVRSSSIPEQFAIQTKELPSIKPDDLIVAVFRLRDRFDVAGWISGSEVRRVGQHRSVGKNPPAWWIQRTSLRPLRSMPGFAGPEESDPHQKVPITATCHHCAGSIPDGGVGHQVEGEQIWRYHRLGCPS